MVTRHLAAKRNGDGSFSTSYPVGDLIQDSFVDFYNEQTGSGFQRDESNRQTRGRKVADYIHRCAETGGNPKLYELTVNARVSTKWGNEGICEFTPYEPGGAIGVLTLNSSKDEGWISLTDGGTRGLGIEIALSRGDITEQWEVDVRIFPDLTLAQEIAQFFLINDFQKKVRTDLGLRVVQRALDEGNLSNEEIKSLQTVVPATDSWRFGASRIASELNSAIDSPWRNRIQMPSDPSKSTTLQSFFTSLSPLLNDADLQLLINNKAGEELTEFIIKILKNFWTAVAQVNSRANEEPETNVLWAPIGSSACHIALGAVAKTILDSSDPDLTTTRFVDMLMGSHVDEYEFWFTKKGKHPAEQYPTEKGDATLMSGAANYKRLAKELEQSWRANLHTNSTKVVVKI